MAAAVGVPCCWHERARARAASPQPRTHDALADVPEVWAVFHGAVVSTVLAVLVVEGAVLVRRPAARRARDAGASAGVAVVGSLAGAVAAAAAMRGAAAGPRRVVGAGRLFVAAAAAAAAAAVLRA